MGGWCGGGRGYLFMLQCQAKQFTEKDYNTRHAKYGRLSSVVQAQTTDN